MKLEKFSSFFPKISADFLARLDRNSTELEKVGTNYLVTTSITLTDHDMIDSLQVDCTAAAVGVILPPAVGSRRRTITKVDASANIVVVIGIVNGASSPTLVAQYDTITVEPAYDGSGVWFRV